MPLLLVLLLILSYIDQSQCFDKIMDFSSLLVLPGWQYYHINGTAAPLEEIYATNGITMSRSRLWAGKNSYDLDANIYLAKRAQKAGLSIYLDVFTQDGWTDPGKIQCYAQWGSTVEDIQQGIYLYFKGIGDRFAKEGIIPKVISLGNEITNGICTIGRMSKPGGPKNTAIFLQAAAKGVHESALGHQTKLMIHLEGGFNLQRNVYFFDTIFKTGEFDPVNLDFIGLTAYPFWASRSATQGNLRRTIKGLQARYRKDVMLVESAWPLKCSRPNSIPPDVKGFPFSTVGQTAWIDLLQKTARDTGALSIAWFEAGWMNNTRAGSHCESTLTFDDRGRALPSLAAFKPKICIIDGQPPSAECHSGGFGVPPVGPEIG